MRNRITRHPISLLAPLLLASIVTSAQAVDGSGSAQAIVTPTIQTAPDDNWVASMDPWPAGATVDLTVDDDTDDTNGVLHADSTTVDPDGNFHFQFDDTFDLERTHYVTVTDTTTTRTHQVLDVFVDSIDLAADTVAGRGVASTDVHVWIHETGDEVVQAADASGNWVADFTGVHDLTALTDGGALQFDSDGDSTYVNWSAPRIDVNPDQNWVQSMSPWPAGATLDVTVDDDEDDTNGVLHASTATVDPSGAFHLHFGDAFDVERGHYVTVTDGTTTKTHRVLELFVDAIDPAADTVAGRGVPDTDVHVWIHETGDEAPATADPSGNWTADFTGVHDLTALTGGGAQQFDDEGDSTSIHWAIPRFEASPDENWVQASSQWQAGTTVTLTIDDDDNDTNGVLHTDTQVVDSGGWFHFNVGDTLDLQRGHYVTVTHGTTTKTHEVLGLHVDAIDLAADTVSGRGVASTDVRVWIHETGDEVAPTADSSGDWTADFTGIHDLTAFTDGGAQQSDDDGDSTYAGWSLPRFEVNPDHNWVASTSPWPAGATVTVTVDDDTDTGNGILHTDSTTVDSGGAFHLQIDEAFHLQRGHHVTATDGTTTKTHQILALFVDTIDLDADTVTGRGVADTEVHVWIHDLEGGVTEPADSSGNWVADFTGLHDLTATTAGGAQQSDDDGDSTSVHWETPKIQTAPDENWVAAMNQWSAGATVTLTVDDDTDSGNGILHTDTQVVGPQGWFHFQLDDTFDLQRDHYVTVTDGTTTQTHQVLPLHVDAIDLAADTVTGRGVADTDVQIWIHETGEGVVTTADPSGDWTADFSGIHDLTPATDGGAQQSDTAGNSTYIGWGLPRIDVNPDHDGVQSMSPWPAGATVTVTVDDDDNAGNGVLHTDSTTVDSGGAFHLYLGETFDVERGHYVTADDGTTSKTHQVLPLHVDAIDLAADTVAGRGVADSEVHVWIHDTGAGVSPTADPSGDWTADFTGVHDLTATAAGGAQQFDDEGDATSVHWETPKIQAAPDENWVASMSQWPAGATVTLTVDDDTDSGNGILHTDTQVVGPQGWFHFQLDDTFDLQRGHHVTAGDGTTTQTHQVLDLFVDAVDVSADTVTGRGVADTDVHVWIHETGDEATATADPSGDWTADFTGIHDLTSTTDGGAQQSDTDGNSTYIGWDSTTGQTCKGVPATIVGTPGGDTIVGTPGRDVIVSGDGPDRVKARGGNDLVCLGDGDDIASAGPGRDTVFGGTGKDLLNGQDGNDTLNGGPGADTVTVAGAPRGVTIDLAAGTATGWGRDVLKSLEHAIGSAHDDVLRGTIKANRLVGNNGPDRIVGRGGNDTAVGGRGVDSIDGRNGRDILRGGLGNDTLRGGLGNDRLDGGAGRKDVCNGQAGTDRAVRCEVKINIP